MPTFSSRNGRMSGVGTKPTTTGTMVLRLAALGLPVVLLVCATLRAYVQGDGENRLLWLGTGFQILLSSLVYRNSRTWQHTLATPVLVLYVIAGVWLYLGLGSLSDWYMQFAQALLLVVSMSIFARQVFVESGAQEVHHACMLAA